MLKKIGKESFLNRIGNSVSAYTGCVAYKSIIASHFEYDLEDYGISFYE